MLNQNNSLFKAQRVVNENRSLQSRNPITQIMYLVFQSQTLQLLRKKAIFSQDLKKCSEHLNHIRS